LSEAKPKRWWLLLLWFGLLASVLAGQHLTALSFAHGHWTPSGGTDPTRQEVIWYSVPPVLIVLLSIAFCIALRWWAPYAPVRGFMRAMVFMTGFLAVLASFGISAWFAVFHFYMD